MALSCYRRSFVILFAQMCGATQEDHQFIIFLLFLFTELVVPRCYHSFVVSRICLFIFNFFCLVSAVIRYANELLLGLYFSFSHFLSSVSKENAHFRFRHQRAELRGTTPLRFFFSTFTIETIYELEELHRINNFIS